MVVTDGERSARIDLLIDGTMIGIEFDGMKKYATKTAGKVLQEKLRDGDLEILGYGLPHVVWQQVHDPARLDLRLRPAGAVPRRRPCPLRW